MKTHRYCELMLVPALGDTTDSSFRGKCFSIAAQDVATNTKMELYDATAKVLEAAKSTGKILYRICTTEEAKHSSIEVGFLWVDTQQVAEGRCLAIIHIHIYPVSRKSGYGTVAMRATPLIAEELKCVAVYSTYSAGNMASAAMHTAAGFSVAGVTLRKQVKLSGDNQP